MSKMKTTLQVCNMRLNFRKECQFGNRKIIIHYLLCQWDIEFCAHAVQTFQNSLLPASLKHTQKINGKEFLFPEN